jgi:hypothetical protein
MKRISISLLVGLLFSLSAFGQAPPPPAPPVASSQITIPVISQLQPVNSAAVQLVGNPGPQTIFYWIVANYAVGSTAPAGPFLTTSAPNTLSGSNYVQVIPQYPANVVSIDVLKTSSNLQPSGACNCAVATGVTSGTINDQSNATSTYTVNPIDTTALAMTLQNEVQSSGVTHLILRQGGVFVADLSAGSSGGGGQPAAPIVTLIPSEIDFGTVQTATPSQIQNITINNSGTAPFTVLSVASSDPRFSTSDITGCNVLIPPTASCSLPFSYTPTGGTSDTATVSVVTTAAIDPLAPPLTVTLTGTGTASAAFPATIVPFGLGSGTISDGGQLNATIVAGVCVPLSSCTLSYASGASVTLTATADQGSTFGTFAGASLTTSPGTFTVTQAQSISATFNLTPRAFTLTVSCAGQGTGTITSNDGQISATCTGGVLTGSNQGTYSDGAAPILTESPSGGCAGGACTFNAWGGSQGTGGLNCATGTTCTPTINANTNISASFALAAAGAPLQLIQRLPGGTAGTNNISGPWPSPQQAGDTNIVSIQFNNATTTVSSVTDTAGNTYTQLGGGCSPQAGNGFTTALYIASNIVAAAAGTNTVTVALSGSPTYRAILGHEYSGLQNPPLDVCSGATGGGSGNINAGNLVTTNASDLLFSTTVVGGAINTPSSGWTQQISFHGNDTEDRAVGATGTYNNLAPQTGVGFSSIDAAFKTTTTVPVTFAFNILCAGFGSGTVTTSGISVTCAGGTPSGSSSAQVAPSTILTLVAAPSGSGFTFGGFSGAGCTTVSPCTTSSITTNTTVTATFNAAGTSTYFVNPSTGSDSNSGLCAVSGTPAGCNGPWQHLSKAISSFTLGASGTIINAAAGTYAETAACAGNHPVFCVNRGGGSLTQRLVIKCSTQWSVPSSTGCLLRNNGGTNGAVEIIANYVDVGAINQFGFDYSNAGGNYGVYANCLGIAGSCSIHIIGNYQHDIGQTYNDSQGGVGCPSSGGILVNSAATATTSDVQVVGNRISNFGLQSRAPKNGGTGCNFAHGLYISAPNAAIENNVIVQAIIYGIQFYHFPCGGTVSNNTVDQAGKADMVIGGGGCATPGKTSINNNIFEAAPQGGVTLGANFVAPCSAGSRIQISHNLVAPGTAITNGNLNGCTDVSGTVTEAPASTFAAYTPGSLNNSYVLKPTSAAINGGVTPCVSGGITPCVPPFDFLNVSRPQRANFDIGAYELP